MPEGVELLQRGGKPKKRIKPSCPAQPLRGLYPALFKSGGILPGELARQSPFILLPMIDALSEEEEPPEELDGHLSGHLRMFYGM